MKFLFSDNIEVTGILSEYIFHSILDRVKKALSYHIKANESAPAIDESNIGLLLSNHFIQIRNWANSIYFYGLTKPQRTDEMTLELAITTNIRKLGGSNNGNLEYKITEIDILKSTISYIILGDPGAGKTTTLKRIAQKIFYSDDIDIKTKFPLLIRLKDLSVGDSLYRTICDIIGIKYEIRKKEMTSKFVDEKTNVEKFLSTTYNEYFIDDIKIEVAVPSFFNHVGVILLLDGLDEIKTEIKSDILKEISKLSENQTENSKIIIACRSGDYHKTIAGFALCEICPLTMEQIKDIASFWLSNSTAFFESLNLKPYKDLSDRPLFLGHLLLLFNKNGILPNKPTDVYYRIIHQLIKDWDYDRDIPRKSKYSEFDTFNKILFLEELAYILTYKIKTKVFNNEILSSAYRLLYDKYSLPIGEMDLVISEIESHNGIVVKSYGDNYEFCHLSLQEFLCASYLVKLQLNSKNVKDYFYEYPAPLAIAISLSGEPGNWMANLITKSFSVLPVSQYEINKARDPIEVLLSRILFERPSFSSNSKELGFAMLFLCFYFYSSSESTINEILAMDNVFQMLAVALGQYKPASQKANDWIFVRLKNNRMLTELNLNMPNEGKVSKRLVNRVYNRFPSHLYEYSDFVK